MIKSNRSVLLFLGGFFALSLIGIWHALPNTDVIGDESGYVGGVLRAMQAHTIVPHIYDAYTLSFLINYLAMIPVLAFVVAIARFSIEHAQTILYAHYDLLYLVPRFVSALAATATAYAFIRLGDLFGHHRKNTYVAVALILSTIIGALIMHTGKMWALNGLLLVLANYFCIKACLSPASERESWWRSSIFWSLGCAFLGIANFPLNAIALMVVPFLLQRFSDRSARWRIALYAVIWALIAGLLILFNLHGWISQNEATSTENSASFAANIRYHLFLILILMPLLLTALITQASKKIHWRLFLLAVGECVLYIVLLSIRAPWVAGHLNILRYDFFVALLFGCMLLATPLARRKSMLALLAVSLIFYVQTIHLLATPPTYNEARTWIVESLAPERVKVINTLVVLNLPKTASAYDLIPEALCESRCAMAKQYGSDPSYKYLVVDKQTDPTRLAASRPDVEATYLITNHATSSASYTLVRLFGDDTETYFSVGYRMGIYDPRFLLAKRLGPPIYIYRVIP